MLGKRSHQRGLFEADNQYLDYVGRDSFYGFLASQRGQLFRDEEFAEFYCPDNGRPSVPPSLLATALLLQTHDRISDDGPFLRWMGLHQAGCQQSDPSFYGVPQRRTNGRRFGIRR